MVGCLGSKAYAYARRQEKRHNESNIMNRDDTEMEDEAGKGQEGKEDKGLEGKEGGHWPGGL